MGCKHSCQTINCNIHVMLNDTSSNKTFEHLNTIKQKPAVRKAQSIICSPSSSTDYSLLTVIKSQNEDLDDYELIEGNLAKCLVLSNLNKDQRILLIKQMSLCSLNYNMILYSEGSIGNSYFIIKSGQMEQSTNNILSKTINEGESIGELSLIHSELYTMKFRAKEATLLWCLHNEVVKSFMKVEYENYYNEKAKYINSIQILSLLNSNYKAMLNINMTCQKYGNNQSILHEGDETNCIHFIKDGEIAYLRNDIEIKTLGVGDYYGDKEIFTHSKSLHNIKANTDVILYSISITTMKQLFGCTYKDYLFVNYIKCAFESCDIEIEMNIIWKIYPCFKLKHYSKNDIIFRIGYIKNSALVIVIDGNIKNKISNKYLPVQKGSILFQDILFNDEEPGSVIQENTLTYNLIAEGDCLLLSCTVNEIEQMTQMNMYEFLDRCKLIYSLKKISLFKHFSQKKIEQLISKVSIETHKKNDIILRKGSENNKFYIIKSGQVEIYINNRLLKTLNDYDSLGENSLGIIDKCAVTAIVKSEGIILYTINKMLFQKIITEENLLNYFNLQIMYQDINIQLEDLNYIKPIREEGFGAVYVVQQKNNKQLYTLKSIEKSIAVSKNIFTLIEMEKQIVLQLDHPFILKIMKTLKDSQRIYFLREFIGEKNLIEIIKEIESLSKEVVMFYFSSLLLSVQYLHSKSIIHRNIKPENVLIMTNGYIKLINFSSAKIIKENTMTVIGSPHYMSPEVIKGEGYSFNSDLWSLGVSLFELMCKHLPFGAHSEEPLQIYKSILSDNMTFPSEIKDKEFKLFIKQILHKNISKRLCSIDLIKTHTWFSDYDWEGLINMTIKPPHIPSNYTKINTINSHSSLTNIQSPSNVKYQSKTIHIHDEKNQEFNKWLSNF